MSASYRPMGALDLSMQADKDCVGPDGEQLLKAGDIVEYRGHVVGGMVRVKFADDHEEIVHPHCFPQLRSK